jgi:hypothetical protein
MAAQMVIDRAAEITGVNHRMVHPFTVKMRQMYIRLLFTGKRSRMNME